jgi:putative ABC transport system substrate-binding protein
MGTMRRAAKRLMALVVAFAIHLALDSSVVAQPVSKPARIGVLFAVTPTAAILNLAALKKGLLELGHVEGKTFVLLIRYGEAKAERVSELALELASLKVDVLVVTTDPTAVAARRATRTIPIVMAASADPVGTGFVTSLAHPGGNVTGLTMISPELSAKRLELLREAASGVSRLAFLWNPDVRGALLSFQETEKAAGALRLSVQSVEVARAEDIEGAFAVMTEQRAQALIVDGPNPVVFSNREKIVSLAERNRLPSLYPIREYVDAGGLISYGPSITDLFRRAAVYVDRILKGAKPSDLPIERPAKFELVVNLKTAKALGLKIPQSLLLRADQVID